MREHTLLFGDDLFSWDYHTEEHIAEFVSELNALIGKDRQQAESAGFLDHFLIVRIGKYEPNWIKGISELMKGWGIIGYYYEDLGKIFPIVEAEGLI